MDIKNNKTDWQKRDIGALWKRESSTQKYLSGYVKVDELGIEREIKVIVFSNKNKKDNAKAPDYRIYVSTPQDKGELKKNAVQQQDQTTAKVKKKSSTAQLESAESLEEDIL